MPPVTEYLFQSDAYLRACEARVVEVGPDGVVLDRTVFYPLGGGQPGDVGVLAHADGRQWQVTPGIRQPQGVRTATWVLRRG